MQGRKDSMGRLPLLPLFLDTLDDFHELVAEPDCVALGEENDSVEGVGKDEHRKPSAVFGLHVFSHHGPYGAVGIDSEMSSKEVLRSFPC